LTKITAKTPPIRTIVAMQIATTATAGIERFFTKSVVHA
jgi:hypothetical protein